MKATGDLVCRICGTPFDPDCGFCAAEIHCAPLLSLVDTLTARHKEYPQEIRAHLFCARCYDGYVRPVAELNKVPGYVRSIFISVMIANLPAMLLPLIVLLPLYSAGVSYWITAVAGLLIVYPALLIGMWLRLKLNDRFFGKQILPLVEKLGMSGHFEITRVVATPIDEMPTAVTLEMAS
jgi:hypothetical protein